MVALPRTQMKPPFSFKSLQPPRCQGAAGALMQVYVYVSKYRSTLKSSGSTLKCSGSSGDRAAPSVPCPAKCCGWSEVDCCSSIATWGGRDIQSKQSSKQSRPELRSTSSFPARPIMPPDGAPCAADREACSLGAPASHPQDPGRYISMGLIWQATPQKGSPGHASATRLGSAAWRGAACMTWHTGAPQPT